MKLKTLISIFMSLSLAISCSKVNFNNAPSTACQDASSCAVSPTGETLFENLTAPAPNNQVDILFIVDNSMSMVQIQQSLAARFPGFVQSLGNLDWRIAIATTDTSSLDTSDTWLNSLPTYLKDFKNGHLVPFLNYSNGQYTETNQYFIDKNTANAQTLFANTIQRPETAFCANLVNQNGSYLGECEKLVSGDERGIYAAILNVTGQNPNYFLRSNAQLHVIVVSNEDERSNGGGFIPQNSSSIPAPGFPIVPGQDNPQDFVGLFNGSSKAVKLHSIAEIPSGTFNFESCVQSQVTNLNAANYYGCFYLQASTLTTGVIENINVGDYTPAFSNIANSIQDTSIHQYSLNCSPGQVIIHAESGVPMPAGYYDGQVITIFGSVVNFNPAISPNTGLTLEWTCKN